MNFKKTILIIVILVLFTIPAVGLENLSLERAMKIAEKENLNLKLSEIEYQKAKINLENLKLKNKYNYTAVQELNITKNYLNSEKTYKSNRRDIIKSVISQYTNLWLLQKQIEAQKLNTKAEKRLFNEMEARFELSQISRIDLLEQSNSYDDADNKLKNLKDNYQQSLLEFKRSLNLETENFEIKELEKPEIWNITKKEALQKGLKNSNSLKIAEINYKLLEKELNKKEITSAASEVELAELSRKTAEINLEKSEEDLRNKIVKFHLALKQANKKIDLMKDKLEKTKRQYQQTKRQFELGSLTKTTLLQYEASLLNSEYQLKNAYLNYYLAKEDLADSLNLEPGVTINVQK